MRGSGFCALRRFRFMNTVILHDWLTGHRGGERVLEAICELYPRAPLYTLLHKKGSTSLTIEERDVHTSILNHIPGIFTHYRKFLPLLPLACQTLRLPQKGIDLVISSHHCVIKGVKIPRGAKHLCYIHSPMRYLYDQYETYFGPHAPLYQRIGMALCRRYLRAQDQRSNASVDMFVANSNFVRERIKTHYRLESKVVYPFVDLDEFKSRWNNPPPKEDFYLMVQALVPNKRVDLALGAFASLAKPLKVIGADAGGTSLGPIPRCVEFLGNLDRNLVVDYFFRAKGFILPGVEDFGITPLEAMAAGTPIIAYSRGGALESLDEEVAEFFSVPSKESLASALLRFEKRTFCTDTLHRRAMVFSRERFKKEFKENILRLMAS